jgi:aspartate/methionine/tyrosine aminotransferase
MRTVIQDLEESRIRQVANAGLGREDVLAFWFGESDEVTPESIRRVAVESLQQGETFYSHNLGLPELRAAIAGYVSAARVAAGASRAVIGADRIGVTSGGVNALMVACQTLVDSGDEVVAVTPVWPNLTAQPAVMGGVVKTVALAPDAQGAWRLDLARLLAAITPATKLLIVNAPNNPTGWTLTTAEQREILAHCGKTGTWILADEVYDKLYFEQPDAQLGLGSAPSFLDVAEPDDRLIVVGSFSKSFLMTGWRLGWMVMPERVTPQVGKLLEFNTSCAPVFVQRAGVAALAQTAQVTPGIVRHLKACRDALVPALQALPGVRVAAAPGGMYAFLAIEGQRDSLALAKCLVAEAGLGLAPGSAFAPESEGWLRWCFASKDPGRLHDGVRRLGQFLSRA